ncbi:hypothetical protein BRCON_1464 [Candidatus Sumerlaea chitinivorans]|uniref:Uncharacterized protein n=1 Tax=Sumerlaea chitinivorans TaxID=2250252 RepID=A0A2Z4Y4V1_SUMC1|nr:hypothetical protein BRCON_1464 [Candidatus Sumerlaea chitinivorans]
MAVTIEASFRRARCICTGLRQKKTAVRAFQLLTADVVFPGPDA